MDTISSVTSLAPPPIPRNKASAQQEGYFDDLNEKEPLTQAKRRFESYRLREKYERPWLDDPRMKKTRWNNWIVRGFFALGFAFSVFICFTATMEVTKHEVSIHGDFAFGLKTNTSAVLLDFG